MCVGSYLHQAEDTFLNLFFIQLECLFVCVIVKKVVVTINVCLLYWMGDRVDDYSLTMCIMKEAKTTNQPQPPSGGFSWVSSSSSSSLSEPLIRLTGGAWDAIRPRDPTWSTTPTNTITTTGSPPPTGAVSGRVHPTGTTRALAVPLEAPTTSPTPSTPLPADVAVNTTYHVELTFAHDWLHPPVCFSTHHTTWILLNYKWSESVCFFFMKWHSF